MPQQNYVLITTFLKTLGPAPVNYIPIAGIPGSVGGAPFSEAAKYYGSTDDMLADGYLSTDQEVLAAAEILGGQSEFIVNATNIPTRVAIIRRETPVAQVDEFTVNAADDGNYTLFISYPLGASAVAAATFAAVSNTVTEIKDGLLASLAIGAFAGIVTGASVDADTGSVTADVAGVPFLLTGVGPNGVADFTVETITENAGLYADLEAGWKVAQFWPVIPDPSEVSGVMYEASRWAQASGQLLSARRNIALIQTDDGDILSATEPNFASVFADLEYSRSFPLYHPDPSFVDKMTAAWFGRYGGIGIGIRAWHMGRLSGTTLTSELNYTYAEVENANAAGVALVERLNGPEDPLRITIRDGNASSVYPVQRQAEDFWWLSTGIALVNMLQDDDDSGVNLDEGGIAEAVAVVDGVNAQLTANGVIDGNRTTVTPVPLSDVPLAEQAIGDYLTTGGIDVSTVLIPKIRRIRASAVFATV